MLNEQKNRFTSTNSDADVITDDKMSKALRGVSLSGKL